ncbi:hypothetical protein NDU88_004383 [Pleurodeles waltl]|uniref:Integrase catalytic domain-containing protein n=1 Tax=Pleurodeles waltl TaxID=8319 RepID=A0AAV7SIT2_PLEWA|nr:hypothetical protein NDU88_004383 [Pleurodeles waltl]
MFLGIVDYCRQWIPNFAEIAKPLQQPTHKDVTDPITLDNDQMKAFTKLRESLCRAPALGMPDYTKPFTLFCHEHDACSLSVLTQVHGGAYHPVADFPATLDPVAAALPGYLRAAAVAESLSQCEGVMMRYRLTVMVPHSVEILLSRTKTQFLTGTRLTRYETSILGAPNVTLEICTVLNPATLLPSDTFEIEKEEEIEQDCLEVIKLLCAALNIEQKVHCSYRSEASGLVEQMNGTLKSRTAKMCAITNLKWPDALPLVLMSKRNTPDRKTGLSPHKILMGRAMRLPAVPANALVNITDDMVLDYCKGLADVLRSFFQQVHTTTLPAIHDPGHNLRAGDLVVVRKHVRKTCLEPRWRGPYQVVLTTMTAVKCAGLPNWIHVSHTKRVVYPPDQEEPLLKAPTTVKQVTAPEPEKEQIEPEVEPELVEDGSITPVRDKGEE